MKTENRLAVSVRNIFQYRGVSIRETIGEYEVKEGLQMRYFHPPIKAEGQSWLTSRSQED